MVYVFAHFCRCLLTRKLLPRNLLSVKNLKRIASQNGDAFEAFSEYYMDVVIIVERKVDLPSLESTFILDVFRDRT